MGAGGKTPVQTEEYADAALDLALGRGGDQAVLKRNMKIEYFGGKLQTVEKRNKGKSRIVGHALRQLIDQSKKIFIMGHTNPDMDCFGASLGIYRMCAICDREPYIVIDNYKEPLYLSRPRTAIITGSSPAKGLRTWQTKTVWSWLWILTGPAWFSARSFLTYANER